MSIINRTFTVISKLQHDHELKAFYKARATKYHNECGCSAGGVFLASGFACCIFYWLFFNHSFATILKSLVFIFLISSLGKLIGIVIARVRLFFLYKHISKLILN